MALRRPFVAGLGIALLAPLVAPAASAAPPPDPTVTRAVGYLRSQQQADGSFEVAQFAGFETPDAVFALASAAQTGPAWDVNAARNAVTSLVKGGRTPLDVLDDLIDDDPDLTSNAAGARAAKVAALVAQPLGLSSTDFDPSNDSVGAVDLLGRVDLHREPDGTYDFGAQFNGLLYAAIAIAGVGDPVPAPLVGQIVAAQNGDGSWDYTGVSKDTSDDVDTTALALLALESAGRKVGDATVKKGVTYLGRRQMPTGAWQAFGADDPNATAVAAMALSALHLDLSTSSWIQGLDVVRTAVPYGTPYTWLASQQDATGRIKSPNDSSGVNTFATSQGVQALTRQWFLDPEHRGYTTRLARALGSPDAAPGTAAATVASDALGPNVAKAGGRTKAATAVLTSSYGREAAAADLFVQAFDRAIDPGGRAYWSKKLITISRPEMLSRLTGSSEFYRLAGGTTPTFVDAAFEAVLVRSPEPGGRAYWIGRLDQGVAVEQVARSLVASTEYRRQQVDAAYQELLGRPADAAGRDYWTKRLATTRIEVLLAGIAGSRELFDSL
ncbi:MAG: DUF4214 domain-containing protein [Acidimicrobiales bacterium]